jgi:signal transduction histidine kinase
MERRQMGWTDDHGWRPAAPPADLGDLERAVATSSLTQAARLQDARTALNAIRGFSELMLTGGAGPLSADGLEYLRQIAAAGRLLEEALSIVTTEGRLS